MLKPYLFIYMTTSGKCYCERIRKHGVCDKHVFVCNDREEPVCSNFNRGIGCAIIRELQ
jgi:hypothetical protein